LLLDGNTVVSIEDHDLHERQKAALAWAVDAVAEGRMVGDIHAEDEARNAVRAYLEHMHATDE
jgi:alkylhydroperoxidase family enzyme